jgi:hypothetical protein
MSMSARDLEQWVLHSSAGLAERGVTALFGRSAGIGRDVSPVWVSLGSSRGTARLVRSPDGSSRRHADRYLEGEELLDRRDTDTLESHLQQLVDAISDPVPPARPGP